MTSSSQEQGGLRRLLTSFLRSVSSLPDGIYADSRNRPPVVKRESLDELGQSGYDAIVDGLRSGTQLAVFQGPGGIMLHSSERGEIRVGQVPLFAFAEPHRQGVVRAGYSRHGTGTGPTVRMECPLTRRPRRRHGESRSPCGRSGEGEEVL